MEFSPSSPLFELELSWGGGGNEELFTQWDFWPFMLFQLVVLHTISVNFFPTCDSFLECLEIRMKF